MPNTPFFIEVNKFHSWTLEGRLLWIKDGRNNKRSNTTIAIICSAFVQLQNSENSLSLVTRTRSGCPPPEKLVPFWCLIYPEELALSPSTPPSSTLYLRLPSAARRYFSIHSPFSQGCLDLDVRVCPPSFSTSTINS